MQTLYFCPVSFFFLSSFFLFFLSFLSFFFSSPNLSHCRLNVYRNFYTWCGPSVNLECRSEICWKCRTQKITKVHHLGTIAQLCRAVSSQLRHILTVGKDLLNCNVCPTCPHDMVNIGPLAAQICWRVWVTPANFNTFRVLAALLHSTRVVGISQSLQHWTRRHLHSEVRLSRWALAAPRSSFYRATQPC